MARPDLILARGRLEAEDSWPVSLAAVLLAVLILAATAPSMLYREYQQAWHFSSATLTGVFAIYSLTVIGTLLGLGSASDVLGRRPCILASVICEAVSMALFITAHSLWWLFLARAVQGAGVGVVGLSAVGATLLDLRPSAATAALINTAAPNAGMAVGAVGTGLLIDYVPLPRTLVYVLLLCAFLGAVPVVMHSPETTIRQDKVSLLQPAGLPLQRRTEFWLLSLGSVAAWAIGGFYMSLSPTVTADLLGAASYTVDSLCIVELGVLGLLSQLLCYRWGHRRTIVMGAGFLSVGMGLLLYSLWPHSTGLFFAGSALLSFGWGLTSIGSFRALVSLAEPNRRAQVVSAVYTVSYVAFSVPAVIAGLAIGMVGLRTTMTVFGIVCTGCVACAALAALDSGSQGDT